MRLAASQRLWAAREERDVFAVLPHMGVDGVAALGHRLWPRGADGEVAAAAARSWVARVRQMGMDVPVLLDPVTVHDGALLGAGAPALFGRLERMVELAGTLGMGSVVLGGPALRRLDWPGWESQEGARLCARLERVALRAQDMGVSLGIKPVAQTSGARFWTGVEEVYEACARVGVAALRPVLDSGVLTRERTPRGVLAAHIGSSPVFVASEAFGGVLCARAGGTHQGCAADLARFAQMGRSPDWVVWEGDGPDTMRQVGAVLRAQVEVVCGLYAPALSAHHRRRQA